MARGTITWKTSRNGWEVQVSMGTDLVTGKRRRKTQLVRGSRDDAERALTKMLGEADNHTVHGSSATVGQVAEQWYTNGLRRWSPTTAHGYRRILDNRIHPRWGKTKLRDVRRADIMGWHDALFAKGVSLPTVRRFHAVLRGVLGHAFEREMIPANPALGKLLESERRPSVAPPAPEELHRLLALIDARDPELGAFLRVAAWCGLRRSEMCGLQWADVDLEGDEINVHQAVVQIGRSLHLKDTKNHQGRRLSIGPDTKAVLTAQRVRVLETGRIRKGSFVWSRSPDGAEPWRPDTVTAQWTRLRNEADVSCRLHDLRHYMATQLLDSGESIMTVQNRLGHRKASTTLDIYSHAIKARDQQAAAKIEQIGKVAEDDEVA